MEVAYQFCAFPPNVACKSGREGWACVAPDNIASVNAFEKRLEQASKRRGNQARRDKSSPTDSAPESYLGDYDNSVGRKSCCIVYLCANSNSRIVESHEIRNRVRQGSAFEGREGF